MSSITPKLTTSSSTSSAQQISTSSSSKSTQSKETSTASAALKSFAESQEKYKYNSVERLAFSCDNPAPLNDGTQRAILYEPRSFDTEQGLVNPGIYALSLARAPNIQGLEIRFLKDADALLLQPLVQLFKEHYPKNLSEVSLFIPGTVFKEQLQKEVSLLSSDIMFALASPQLTFASLNEGYPKSSRLTSESLTTFFTRSPNLRQLSLHFECEGIELTVPFQLCQNLEELTLKNCRGISQQSFENLKKCKKLHTLKIKDGDWEKSRKFLMGQHGLDLRILELQNDLIHSDYQLYATTRRLSNLEVLRLDNTSSFANRITDAGLSLLADNCPKLISFILGCFEKITEDGFVAFIKKARNLQKLKTSMAYQLSEKALVGLTASRLKVLSLVHWWSLTENGLRALAANCPNLEFLEIHCCDRCPPEAVVAFVKSAQKLRAVDIALSEQLRVKIPVLTTAFPHINWHPKFQFDDDIPLDISEVSSKSTSAVLEAGTKVSSSAKEMAAETTQKSHQANMKSTSAISEAYAKTSKHSSLSQELLDQFLYEATAQEYIEDVIAFLKMGANLHIENETASPLDMAAFKGNVALVKCFHQHGANLKRLEKMLGALSQPKHLEVLVYLIENGCNPNAVNDAFMTPLEVMAARKVTWIHGKFNNTERYRSVSLECAKALVSHGADTSNHAELVRLAKKNDNRVLLEYFTKVLKPKVNKPLAQQAASKENVAEGSKKATEEELSRSICARIYALVPVLREAVSSYITGEFAPFSLLKLVHDKPPPPRRGIYYFIGESDDHIAQVSFRECDEESTCLEELQKEGRSQVIEKAKSYDPISQIIICTPRKKFFLIKDVLEFRKGKSKVEIIS